MKKIKQWIFFLDLDGTVLAKSSTSEIHPKVIDGVKRLREAGHIVCIATGRPWRATIKAYNTLSLDTIVANYNGAQIHNPSDYNFVPDFSYLNLNDVLYILGDEKLESSIKNKAIEGVGWVQLEKRDEALERVFGFTDAPKFKVGIYTNKLPLKPCGAIVDLKESVDVVELLDYLQRKYGDLVEFSSWSKGEGLTPVVDITDIGVKKSRAVSLISRYYDIPIERTVSIGDGYNDVPMFKTTEISVAMSNSNQEVKDNATFITQKDNKEAGLVEFIDKFLGDNSKEFIKEQTSIRRKKHYLKEQTTVAH